MKNINKEKRSIARKLRYLTILATISALLFGITSAQSTESYDFESGDFSNWEELSDKMTISSSTVYQGSNSATSSQQSGDNPAIRASIPPTKIEEFSYVYQEGQSTSGHTTYLESSNGNSVIAFGSNNPEMEATDDQDTHKFSCGAYNEWIRWTGNFDWGAGTIEVTCENLNDGSTDTQNLNIANDAQDVEYVYFGGTHPDDLVWTLSHSSAFGGSSTEEWLDNFKFTGNINEPPNFDSLGTNPKAWSLEPDIDVLANVSDSGGVASVSASVWEGGSRIVSDVSLTQSMNGNWTVSDLFEVDEGDVWYNVSIKATDDSGATTVEWINKSVVSTSLSWNDNSNNEDGFNLYTNLTGGGFDKVADTGSDTSSFDYLTSALNFGDSRCFRVAAYNQYGESSPAEDCLVP